jgi:acetyl-CoA carboxylase biotin carboxyl carrier protein
MAATVHRIESLVTGTVWKVERGSGDRVAEGDTLLILESMKMEIPIEAPAAGVLQQVLVAEGESVDEGQVLALLISA